MGEKIAKTGIKRDNDLMYYIKNGDVWATPRKKPNQPKGKAAKVARDRIKDGEPSSAEVQRVFVHAARIATFIEGHAAPSAAGLWSPTASRLQTIAGAYGTEWRSPR